MLPCWRARHRFLSAERKENQGWGQTGHQKRQLSSCLSLDQSHCLSV